LTIRSNSKQPFSLTGEKAAVPKSESLRSVAGGNVVVAIEASLILFSGVLIAGRLESEGASPKGSIVLVFKRGIFGGGSLKWNFMKDEEGSPFGSFSRRLGRHCLFFEIHEDDVNGNGNAYDEAVGVAGSHPVSKWLVGVEL
jgi:hypothetical protein